MENLIIVKNIRINVTIGKKYQVSLRNKSGKDKDNIRYNPFEGELIQETINHLTFKNNENNYCESFLKKDFAIKYYEVRERRGIKKWSELLNVSF